MHAKVLLTGALNQRLIVGKVHTGRFFHHHRQSIFDSHQRQVDVFVYVSFHHYGVDISFQDRDDPIEHFELGMIGAPLFAAAGRHVGVTIPTGNEPKFVWMCGNLPGHAQSVGMVHAQHAES